MSSHHDNCKVVLVDDERVIADTLAVILSARGYDCLAAYDGAEALEQVRRERPDLLLTDVIMPEMNGIDLAIETRRLLPECAILLLSGQAATADLLREARRQGFE